MRKPLPALIESSDDAVPLGARILECIACRNTQDHVHDATARECLHSKASGMNTPPRPRA